MQSQQNKILLDRKFYERVNYLVKLQQTLHYSLVWKRLWLSQFRAVYRHSHSERSRLLHIINVNIRKIICSFAFERPAHTKSVTLTQPANTHSVAQVPLSVTVKQQKQIFDRTVEIHLRPPINKQKVTITEYTVEPMQERSRFNIISANFDSSQ
jgi:hypothetical protein